MVGESIETFGGKMRHACHPDGDKGENNERWRKRVHGLCLGSDDLKANRSAES